MLSRLLVVGIVLVVIAAVIVAATSGWAAGAVVLVLGLGLAVIVNPSTWGEHASAEPPPEQPDREVRF
ncbi:MAG TPA: hypothetical protein VFF69_14215 [Phycisphaerales bacterium]|nr:hypothetical protein [Phycisphaerales bacterium]